MMKTTQVATKTFKARLYMHGSWGAAPIDGEHESTMALYFRTDNTGFIEWDLPSIDESEEIGLTFEVDAKKGVRTLCDYDGIMALPVQAVDLMREAGVIVPDEYDDRVETGENDG